MANENEIKKKISDDIFLADDNKTKNWRTIDGRLGGGQNPKLLVLQLYKHGLAQIKINPLVLKCIGAINQTMILFTNSRNRFAY